MRSRSIGMTILAAAFATSAHAGSTLELKTTEYDSATPIHGTVVLTTEEEALRLEINSISSNESGGLIYNKADEAIVALDHVSQEFYVISKAEIDAMAAQLGQAMKEMREALDRMPPEQRAMAEQMMASRMPKKQAEGPRGELRKTGETETIAGLECDHYDVMQGEHRFRDLCVVSWDSFPEGQEVAMAMVGLGDFFTNMREAFAESGGLDLMDRQQDMFSYMKEVNGYPVRSREYAPDGSLSQETLLTSASHGDIDMVLFTPPAEYRQKSLR